MMVYSSLINIYNAFGGDLRLTQKVGPVDSYVELATQQK